MKPTEICFLSEWRTENWRRSWIREPLPKELLMEAWKAMVGAERERCLTHRACERQHACRLPDTGARTMRCSTLNQEIRAGVGPSHPNLNSIQVTALPLYPKPLPITGDQLDL